MNLPRFARVLIGALVAIPVALDSQQPLFRAGTELVDLYVTVTDQTRRLVPDLTQDEFEILDNKKPQEIAFFSNEVRPITAVVMLDTSASMTPSLDLLMAGAEQFLIRMLPEDRAQVGAFNDKVEMVPGEFISDRDELVDALDTLDFGNPTRLYDAIALSIDALKDIEGRRVVVVFTDGDDTGSDIGAGEALKRAVAEEVMIYAIGLEADYFNGVQRVRSRPDRSLRRFAEETGGGYFELKKTDELGPTFTRVAQELHSQYVLAFSPPVRDAKVHSVDVRVKRRGMTARARKSYLAPAGASTQSSR